MSDFSVKLKNFKDLFYQYMKNLHLVNWCNVSRHLHKEKQIG